MSQNANCRLEIKNSSSKQVQVLYNNFLRSAETILNLENQRVIHELNVFKWDNVQRKLLSEVFHVDWWITFK
jgi:hypothetical protein